MGKKENVLVSGAGGNIGSAAASKIAEAGYRVARLSRAPTEGFTVCNLAGPFESGLALLPDKLGYVPDAIVHSAAAVPNDSRYPDNDASADLTRAMDEHIFKASSQWGSRLIYLSGCTLYERNDPGFKTPGSPLSDKLTPYLVAKREGERLFERINATIVRVSSPVGPQMKPSVVMKRFVDRCRDGQAIEIWGSGSREQDFVHVDDVAGLLVAALGKGRATAPITVNCASGTPVTMIDLALKVIEIVGRGTLDLTRRSDPAEGETARYSLELTQKLFGWKPAIGLAEMIRSVQ